MADVAQNSESRSGDFYCRDSRIKIEPCTYIRWLVCSQVYGKRYSNTVDAFYQYITRTYYAKRFVISLA